MSKPINLVIEEESAKLRSAIVEAVNQSALPAPVTRIIVESTARDISIAIGRQLDAERAGYKEEE